MNECFSPHERERGGVCVEEEGREDGTKEVRAEQKVEEVERKED